MMTESSQETARELKELAQAHHVRYEVWPESLMVKGRMVKVGYDLELSGVHDHPEDRITPGCPHCQHTYLILRQIAEWILPTEARPSRYEIEPFDHALHVSPKRRFQPEVVLSVKILHRHGFDQPVDPCEERCLKEMREALASIGVTHGQWRETGSRQI